MVSTAIDGYLYESREVELYAPGMVKRVLKGIQEIRLGLAARVVAAEQEGEHTVLLKHGKPCAVIVPMDWYRTRSAEAGEPTDL